MLVYYLKQAFRRIYKNTVFSILNIGGFAIGFAVCIILSLFIYKEYSVDTNIKNHEHIYRLIDAKQNKSRVDYDIAESLKAQFPDVQYATPLNYLSSNSPIPLSRKGTQDNIQVNSVICTTNEFFDLFSIRTILSKDQTPFNDLQSIVLTKSTAMKLFGKIEAIDEVVLINNELEVKVSGVVEDFPQNTSLSAELFLNTDNENFRMSKYSSNGVSFNPLDLYVKLREGADALQVQSFMNESFPENKSKTDSVALQNITDIYLTSGIDGNKNKAGSKGLIFIFVTIALLVIFMSIINYVNIVISNQLTQLKEIGIKLTVGAGTRYIRSYYLTEVSVSVILSFVIALIVVLLALPYASTLLGTELDITWLGSPVLLGLYGGIILGAILISALAPLYIISKFDLQKLLGKSPIIYGKQSGKKVLTVFQAAISIVLLICLIGIQKQLYFAKTADLGFDKELVFKLDLPDNFNNQQAFKQRIDDCSFVKNSSYSHGGPGFVHIGMTANFNKENNFNVSCIYIDDNFLKTFGIKLADGREFLGADKGRSCYINQTAFKKYGWESLENRKFDNGREGGFDIVGVVEDFHIWSMHDGIKPVCLMYNPQYLNLNIRFHPGDLHANMAEIKKIWAEFRPYSPMAYQFYDEYFDSLYRKEERQSKAITFFSIITFVITCLGLLGQVIHNCVARVKEIGIRKVNGAKVSEILGLLNKDFIKWIVVAFVIASPVAYFVLNKWLESFAYKTTLSWWIFALAGVLALFIALLTVSWQSWRAATRNPVEALRYE
ncbi:ABC transporter permease [Puteibacter caeruleilacunae]|nr:ABC transporter permease [Puteibacter caeruleilacunae]